MNKLILASILTLTSINCLANNDDWTTDQIVKEVISESLLVSDYQQTIQIRHHKSLHETNIILGKHPSNDRIEVYFGSVIVSHLIISDLLSNKYRDYFLDGTIGLELIVVGHNKQLGLSIKF